MKKFLELARSYGLGLIMAHQSVKQIPDELMGMIEDNTFTQIAMLMGGASANKIQRMMPGVSEEDLTSMLEYTGYARFKKIHPSPFTFDNVPINAEDEKKVPYFASVGLKEVKKWKDAYKNKYYKRIDEIKDDIQERYGLTHTNQITENSSASVKSGKATGKIRRVK